MTENVTIAGEAFTVNPPYAAGHTLTENEAVALNRYWTESVTNGIRQSVKDAKEANAFDHAAYQAKLDEHAASYQFGQRARTGTAEDPVQIEAVNRAKQIIKDNLKAAGRKMKSAKTPNGVTHDQIEAAAQKLLAGPMGETIRAQAQEAVAQRQQAAQETMGELQSLLG
jgi:hypothetical protein